MKKRQWVLRWESVHPFYRMEAFMLGHQKRLVLGSDYTGLLGFCKNNVMQMYYLQKDLDRKTVSSFALFTAKKGIQQYCTLTIRNYTSLIDLIKKTIAQLQQLSDKELAKRYDEIIWKLASLLCSYDLSRPEFFEHTHKILTAHLQERGVPFQLLNDVFSVLAMSTEQTLLDKEELDWLTLVLNTKRVQYPSNESITEQLKAHQQNFGWIGTSEQRRPWTIAHYKTLLEEDLLLSERELRQRIARKKVGKTSLEKQQRDIIRTYHIRSDIQYLFTLVGRFAHLRLTIRLKWVESGFLLTSIFKEIARRTHIQSELLEYYRRNEMKALLLHQKRVPLRVLKRRTDYAFMLIGKTTTLTVGKALDTLKKRELPVTNYHEIKEVKGHVANPGFAVGKAKIISALSKDQEAEMATMRRGDILVTGMTRPHLMVAIRKAAAIVTDEGGIASHAAIISREYNIPCIIGTKIATKIFKNGDYIEVDARNGIVRKR